MKRLKKLVIFSLILVLAYVGYFILSWSPLPEDRAKFKTTSTIERSYTEQINIATKKLKLLLEDLNVPSVSVAVGINDQIIWAEAIGYADLQNEIKASSKTSYRIGSTSKAITSIAIMKLVQQNKLDIDIPVSQILSDYPKKKWDFSTRQLLSHTAGFPDYEDLNIKGGFYTLLNFKQFNSVEEGLTIFKTVPLLYKPGSQFKYNSFDVVLASRVLEEVSGNDFRMYLRNEIFHLLRMENTYADHSNIKSESEAKFYEITTNGEYRDWHTFGFPHPNQNLSYKWAGGGMLSTPTDLVKLGNALLNDTTFISTKIRNIFFEPQRLSNGDINEQKYALGWRSDYDYVTENLLGEDTPVWMVHHGGVSKGSMNLLYLFPYENVVIDVAINGREKEFDFTPFWYHVIDIVKPFLNTQYETQNH